jgi:energy-coupling factor transporter ATP-binding protein EcfA2
LGKLPLDAVFKLVEDSESLTSDSSLMEALTEGLYNYWRQFDRFIICDSTGDSLDKRPFRTFNSTIESLTHVVRQTYRDVQENITGQHPNIYRQVCAGAEAAVIALPKYLNLPDGPYRQLHEIPVIRQVLINPPLLLTTPNNTRTGKFEQVSTNPLDLIELNPEEWLCYPAKVGGLLILLYVHEKFLELGLSLSNLFELADDEFLTQPIEALFLYGVPGRSLYDLSAMPAVFYDDNNHHLLASACPNEDQFGYFGYLKKMALTLHNIKVMQQDKLPYHGAMVRIVTEGDCIRTVLIIGDTGAGKSETLEALRIIGEDRIKDMMIIADDMGSLEIDSFGQVIGYGTEIGAFVRLDDLQPGYAFGQLDRSIIMNPNQVNARIVLPVTTYKNIINGYPVDMVLYANNYEEVDEDHPILERLSSSESALHVFREGTAMSKGTTTSTGLVHTYFVNIFGAVQYRSLHDELAGKYFKILFRNDVFIGQMRTRLGISGWEQQGPEEAAKALLKALFRKDKQPVEGRDI